jgi:8-oxo-dGTP pyrophosphatase MutT (NUDIX family)
MTGEENEIRPWTVHQVRTVYDGRPFVRVELADVTAPDGSRFNYHVVRLPRVAIALVVDQEIAAVLLLRRERWVVGRWGYELFGGLVEDGETPAVTAEREALEESGWMPRGQAEHLLAVHPLPGIADAAMDIYLWRHGADRVGEPTDAQEVGDVVWMPLDRVAELAARGELLGAGTMTALLYYLVRNPRR